jgi:hypothetical protein
VSADAAEVRGLAMGVILAAVDARDADMHVLLADADRETLSVAVGGLALAVSAVLGEVPEERRAVIREHLAGWALEAAARPRGAGG